MCGDSHDAETVLISIDGTGDGRIAEAVPVHLECAVATNYNRSVGVIYRRVKDCG